MCVVDAAMVMTVPVSGKPVRTGRRRLVVVVTVAVIGIVMAMLGATETSGESITDGDRSDRVCGRQKRHDNGHRQSNPHAQPPARTSGSRLQLPVASCAHATSSSPIGTLVTVNALIQAGAYDARECGVEMVVRLAAVTGAQRL